MDSNDDHVTPRLRIMQTIALALVLGVVSFLGVALFMVWIQNQGRGLAPGSAMLSYTALAIFVVTTTAALLVPTLITEQEMKRLARTSAAAPADPAALLGIRQTVLIITLALLEGSAFLGCIAYLLEVQPAALAVVAADVLMMLTLFPTRRRLVTWLESQSRRLNELRQ